MSGVAYPRSGRLAYHRFFHPFAALSSGFFISPDGYILRNNRIGHGARELIHRGAQPRQLQRPLVTPGGETHRREPSHRPTRPGNLFRDCEQHPGRNAARSRFQVLIKIRVTGIGSA